MRHAVVYGTMTIAPHWSMCIICYKNCNVDQPLVLAVNQDLRQTDATILQIMCGWLTYSDVISRFGQFLEVTVVVYKQ